MKSMNELKIIIITYLLVVDSSTKPLDQVGIQDTLHPKSQKEIRYFW
jgi:hypothetical protein